MSDIVVCSFCGAATEPGKACIGFGIEKPISKSHYFCCEEHRSEYIVSETAAERGIPYKMREYANKGKKMLYTDGLSDDDMGSLNDGEIISCIDDDGMVVLSIIMDPFGDVKEY
jgi:hypothetical protein